MSFERARQPEQIAQRRKSILESTLALFEDVGFDCTKLADIGRRAGVSKASVYRYFESKEAIFLELLAAESEAWVRDVEGELASLAGAGTVESVARIMADSLDRRPRLANLSAKLASVLEKNLSVDAIREFKRAYMALMFRLVNALHAALPALSLEAAQRFLSTVVVFSSGLYPATHPAPAAAEVLAEPEFEPFRANYRDALLDAATLLLTALTVENAPTEGQR